ncbi:hypothetical protein ACH4U5_07220 [Streptomyces sp. NPDC020858]|uniref:hypothetical protein n=1 Tax=Streptomyces sp. NPDC020858 TaxID=3365097 RepID=UPI0037BBB1B9
MSAHGQWDFGLSALTQAFRDVWTHETADEVVAAVASRHARTLLADVFRLLESPLPDWALMALWQTATGRNYDLEYLGIDVRDWLRRVADISHQRIAEEGARPSSLPSSVRADLSEDVLGEIRPVLAALDESTRQPPRRISGVVASLEMVVAEVDPDLGFRLFLRSIAAYRVPITNGQFARYRELGDRFGYGNHHFFDIDGLTDLD